MSKLTSQLEIVTVVKKMIQGANIPLFGFSALFL